MPSVPCGRGELGFGLLALPLLLAGLSCGGAVAGKPVFPVRGQVLVEDKPVPDVVVVLHPVGPWESGTNRPYAQTDAEGRFTVTTYKTHDGAPAGEYKVAIVEVQGEDDQRRADEGSPKKSSQAVATKYGNPQTSGLRVQVKEARNDLEPFRLKPGKRGPAKTTTVRD